MGNRNVTISLPEQLLQEARHLAVDRGVSLSKFLAMMLEEHVRAARGYGAAQSRLRQRLKAGFELGTNGSITWTRDELHER